MGGKNIKKRKVFAAARLDVGPFSFYLFSIFQLFFKMRHIVDNFAVSPNHATLNQSMIFSSHIVLTTGCYQYLSRFGTNPSLSRLAAARTTQKVTATNKGYTACLQIYFCVKKSPFVLFTIVFSFVDAES